MKRKILANVLTLCMLFSMLPMTAFAVDTASVTFDFGETGIVIDETEGAVDNMTKDDTATDTVKYNVTTPSSDATFKLNTTAVTDETKVVKVTVEYGTNAAVELEAVDGVYTLDNASFAETNTVTVTLEEKQDPSATTYTVSGTVTKSAEITDNTIDVDGLTVNLYKMTGGTRGESAGTASVTEGKYSIADVEAGIYQAVIAAEKGKYAESTADVTVSNADVADANIELKPEATNPPEPEEDVEITEVNITIAEKIQAGDTATFPEPKVTTNVTDVNEAVVDVKTTWTDASDTSAEKPATAGVYTATFEVTAKTGYKLADTVKYTVNGTEAEASTLTATVTAVTEAPLAITVAKVQNGQVTVDPTAAYEGETVTITATPSEGFEVDTVKVTYAGENEGDPAVDVTVDKDNTFTMPAKDVTVTVTFKKAEAPQNYKITVNKSENGTVTASKAEAAEGDEITLTVKPAQGYKLGTLTYTVGEANPVNITGNKFTMPAGDVVINATFTLNERHISFTYGEPANGVVKATVEGSDEAVTKVAVGAKVTLTITPEAGYGLDTLKVIGDADVANQVNGGKYTFTMPDEDVNVRATFVAVVDIGEAESKLATPTVGSTLDATQGTEEEKAFKTAVNDIMSSKAGDVKFDNEVLDKVAEAAAKNAQVKASDVTTLDTAIGGISGGTDLTAIQTAVTALKGGNALPSDVTVVTQLYMDVQVTGVTAGTATSITFDITPMVQNILTTNPEDMKLLADGNGNANEANAVVVTAPAPAYVADAVEVQLPLPDAYVNDTLWVNHTKDSGAEYLYSGTLNKTTHVLTFVTQNGFSDFTVYADAAGAGVVAQIGTNGYKTLAAAVAAATDKDEIKVLSTVNTETGIAVPDGAKTFTITAENKDFLPAVAEFKATTSADWTVTATASADGKTITVVVAAKDAPGPNPGPGPSGGGGGGGVSSNVTIDKTTNGKVTVTPTAPSKGSTVTITLTPDTGYVVGTVTVTDKDGKAVELTKVSDTKYTFTMPDGKVKVAATFTKVADGGFTDVAADAYYADAVKWAVDKGITNGLTATTFGPNNSCTRGQMVTFLWRAAGSPKASATNSFTDVASGEYYYDAVLWAVEKGITNGTTATTFSPNATVNRGQTVTFLYRYAGSPAATGTTSFTDVAADAYYANAVKWAVAEEITNGTSSTTFAPASNCTRGQIVTFLYRQIAE